MPYHPDYHHINIEAIHAEACKSAWLYDTMDEACPYPYGMPAAREFHRAFTAAKNAMPGYGGGTGAAQATGAGGAQA
jgi:hypothetical protein